MRNSDQHLDPEAYNRAWCFEDARQARRDAKADERDDSEPTTASESPIARRKRLAEEDDNRFGKDRDEWKHEAAEWQRLK